MIFFIFTTLLKSNKNKNNQRQFYNSNIERIFDIHKYIQNFFTCFFQREFNRNRLNQHKPTLNYPSTSHLETKHLKAKKNHPANEMIFYIFTTLPKSNKNKNNQRKFYNSNIEIIFDIHKFIQDFLHVFFKENLIEID